MLVTKKVALLEGNAHRVASAEKKVCFRHPDDGVNQYHISFGLNHLPLQTSTRPSFRARARNGNLAWPSC